MNQSLPISIKYGVFIAITLIAFFLVLRLVGLHENPWLRLFNGVAMAAGIFFALKYYKLKTGGEMTYINGIKTAIITGFVATFIFSLFMAIYLFHLDPEFTELLMGTWFSNYDAGPGLLVFIIILEGLASSVVMALSFMQYFKKSKSVGQYE